MDSVEDDVAVKKLALFFVSSRQKTKEDAKATNTKKNEKNDKKRALDVKQNLTAFLTTILLDIFICWMIS